MYWWERPYDWRDCTIVGILERMDYCGHTVNFKSYSKSHKLKKRIPTTKEQRAIFYNTHEAKETLNVLKKDPGINTETLKNRTSIPAYAKGSPFSSMKTTGVMGIAGCMP